MANPQLENGYTSLANEIMDALCMTRIPGEARQILDVIIRKTYGWHKKEDAISLSQFSEMTGLSKSHIVTNLKKLFSMNIITEKGNAITEKGNSICKIYEINKDCDCWIPLPKKETSLPLKVKTITEKGNGALPKKGTTKETITKERKDNGPFVLPGWIPEETWNAYLEIRNKKRAAKTPHALTLVVKALEKISKEKNQNPVDILNKSIRSGWTDVYPLKLGDIELKKEDWHDRLENL